MSSTAGGAPRNGELVARARQALVGGVSSPVRSFRAVGGEPRFVRAARGCTITDEDGRSYTDFVLSWGAVILGHADPRILAALGEAAARGTTYGAPAESELLLAEQIRRDLPSVERIRFVSSGTEAAMSALRVARGYTGRNGLIMFEGCYHGHADPFLARAGSGVAAAGLPGTAGVTAGASKDTVVLPFGDEGVLEDAFKRARGRVAAAFVEPIAANMGVVVPPRSFLQRLRELCDDHGALLVFDEVVTGYRVGRGGAQGLFGITPDVTCLGKVIGGGLPAAAFGGTREVMEVLAPLGPVYQAGTLSGNPLSMAAGLATLDALDAGAYERLESAASRLERGLLEAAAAAAVPLSTRRAGGMVGLHLRAPPVEHLGAAKAADVGAYRELFHGLLERGVYFPPSPLEALFLSLAHEGAALERACEALGGAFESVARRSTR